MPLIGARQAANGFGGWPFNGIVTLASDSFWNG
jgi:hypothetical protein